MNSRKTNAEFSILLCIEWINFTTFFMYTRCKYCTFTDFKKKKLHRLFVCLFLNLILFNSQLILDQCIYCASVEYLIEFVC